MKHVSRPTNPVRKLDRDALQNLCCDCASRCVAHKIGGYSSLIVYKRGLPVRMNFGSKRIAKANSSLCSVSARGANHPDQCLHCHHSQLLADTRHRLDYDPGMG